MLLFVVLACQPRTELTRPSTLDGFWERYESQACSLSCDEELPLEATCDVEDDPPRCLWFDPEAAERCVDTTWTCGEVPAACEEVCNVAPATEPPAFDPESALPGVPHDPEAPCADDPGWSTTPRLATTWATHLGAEGLAHHLLYIEPNAHAIELGHAPCTLVAEAGWTTEGTELVVEDAIAAASTCGPAFPTFEPRDLRYRLTDTDVSLEVEGTFVPIAEPFSDDVAVWWSHPQRCEDLGER